MLSYLEGIVVDDVDSSPINFCVLSLQINQISDTTESDGKYQFDSLSIGPDILHLNAQGYIQRSIDVDLIADTLSMDFSLVCDSRAFADTTRLFYYYVRDTEQYLSTIDSIFFIKFDSTISSEEIETIMSLYDLQYAPLTQNRFIAICSADKLSAEYYTHYELEKFCGLGNRDYTIYSNPIFDVSNSLHLLTDEFIVGIDTTLITVPDFMILINEHHVQFIREPPSLAVDFILRVTRMSNLNALDMANMYHGFDFVNYSEPNFTILFNR
jgi:hypothetical protein